MVKGTLNWDKIDFEVCAAVKEFLAAEKIKQHQFLDTHRLTEFIQEHPHRNRAPHLRVGWFRIHTRCTTCFRRMKWQKWSGHVYLIPRDGNGSVRMPERVAIVKRAEAEA